MNTDVGYYLEIVNKGRLIASTNFWDSPMAGEGIFYLSWNAGVARLMVPDKMIPIIDEMRPAKYVIVSHGPWPEAHGQQGLEILFEDESASPFCIHLTVQQQTDRVMLDKGDGSPFDLVAWTRSGPEATWTARYRDVPKIPCLLPWGHAPDTQTTPPTQKS